MQVFSYSEPSYWDIVSNKIYIKWTPLCGVRTHENYLILITDSTFSTRHNWKFKFISIPGKWHQFEYRVTIVTLQWMFLWFVFMIYLHIFVQRYSHIKQSSSMWYLNTISINLYYNTHNWISILVSDIWYLYLC